MDPAQIVIDGIDGAGKDAVLERAVSKLAETHKVHIVRSTEIVEGNESSARARAVLTSAHSTPHNRFLAALYLYQTNLLYNPPPPGTDVCLIYRGWAGFYAYNPISFLDKEDHFTLIPDADAAVLITASFDTLTQRLNERRIDNGGVGLSHQDDDLEYRKTVYDVYTQAFLDLSLMRMKPHAVIMNEDGFLDKSVDSLVRFVSAVVNGRKS
jgi:thymidylate kinase